MSPPVLIHTYEDGFREILLSDLAQWSTGGITRSILSMKHLISPTKEKTVCEGWLSTQKGKEVD